MRVGLRGFTDFGAERLLLTPPRKRRKGGKSAALVFHAQGAIAALLLMIVKPSSADPLPPAPETGACSLEDATPVTVALVDDDLDLLLDDGRRVTLAGLEYPADAGLRGAARKALSDWLAGRQAFLAAAGTSRWGGAPGRLFAAAAARENAPLVSAGAALLDAGLARYRPDAAAAPCVQPYLAAEGPARAAGRGLWALPGSAVIDLAASSAGASGQRELFLNRKGMILVEGVVRSVGAAHGTSYLNFGLRKGADFAVVISRRNLGMFERAGMSPQALIGRRMRVRGLIETTSGPRIEVSAPSDIEFVEPARP